MPLPNEPTQTTAKTSESISSRLGLDLRSLAANAARVALAPVTVIKQPPPPAADGAPAAERPGNEPLPRPEPPWAPPGHVASAHQTAQAMRLGQARISVLVGNVTINIQNDMEDPEDIQRDIAAAMRGERPRNAVAVRAPAAEPPLHIVGAADNPPPANEVAVLNRAVTDPLPINPEWHDVRNLPGYTQGGVMRRIIRQTFQHAKDAQLEQIHMICDLLSPAEHVQAVARWIHRNATPVDCINFDYDTSVPGFTADFLVYQDQKTTYIVTQDVGGHYVYICPGGLDQTPALTNAPRAATTALPAGQTRRVNLQGPGV